MRLCWLMEAARMTRYLWHRVSVVRPESTLPVSGEALHAGTVLLRALGITFSSSTLTRLEVAVFSRIVFDFVTKRM